MIYAAIDFGISNTDAVAYLDGDWHRWTRPSEGRPDPDLVRAILAAGGIELAGKSQKAPSLAVGMNGKAGDLGAAAPARAKLAQASSLRKPRRFAPGSFTSLRRLAVTGGQHNLLPERIEGCPLIAVNEVPAIGRGGQALAGLAAKDDVPLLVVSAGSGTAVVAAQGDAYAHVTGTAVGGGTLLGLSRLLLHTVDHDEIDALARRGDPNGVDLSLADVVTGPIGNLPADATAANFGRLAREDVAASREDLAAALVTMVGQTIALVAINAARAQAAEHGLDTVRIVVIGHLIDMASMRGAVERVGELYGVPISLPVDSGYGTALGALLHAADGSLSYASAEGTER